MEYIHSFVSNDPDSSFQRADLFYDKEYYIDIGIYPNQISALHIYFKISVERPMFITKQIRNLSLEEKIWLNDFMKKQWPHICKYIKKHSGHQVNFSRPDYTKLPDYLYNNDIVGDGDMHIHRFDLPEIGLCEIITKPYREYPVFYIEKIPSRRLVSIISMIEPIYMAKNCIRLNKVQKKALVEETSKNAMAWGEWDSRMSVWDSIKLSWNSGEFEPIFNVTTMPDYIKLPE